MSYERIKAKICCRLSVHEKYVSLPDIVMFALEACVWDEPNKDVIYVRTCTQKEMLLTKEELGNFIDYLEILYNDMTPDFTIEKQTGEK